MSATEEKAFFLTKNEGIGHVVPEDDLLHPEHNKTIADVSLSETQYFGFCVPDENILGFGYLWHHPNLHVVSGGVLACQGLKRYHVEAEIADFRAFMSDDVLANDLYDYKLSNSYGVKIEKPMMEFSQVYSDPERDNRFELQYTAVQPAVMFADGRHFEQAMRVSGQVVIRGISHAVNCFGIRDRSWGKPRQETIEALPPFSWLSGVFSEDFAFNCGIFEQSGNNPEILNHFDIPIDRTVSGGWIYRDGKLGHLVSGKKRVVRDDRSHFCTSIEIEITDSLGRTLLISGSVIAGCPMTLWPNGMFPFCLARYECEGMTAYGDLQEAIWNDYAVHMNGVRPVATRSRE